MEYEEIKTNALSRVLPIIDNLEESCPSDEGINEIISLRNKKFSIPGAIATVLRNEGKGIGNSLRSVIRHPLWAQYLAADYWYSKCSKPVLAVEEELRTGSYVEGCLQKMPNWLTKQFCDAGELLAGVEIADQFQSREGTYRTEVFIRNFWTPIEIANWHIYLAKMTKHLIDDPTGFKIVNTTLESSQWLLNKYIEDHKKKHGGVSPSKALEFRIQGELLRIGVLHYKIYYDYFR